MEITRERASFYGFRRCQYCSSLKGSTRSLISTLKAQGAGKNLEITYLSDTDTIYIRTKIGFWKVWWKDDAGFLLYHLNQFDPEKSTKELLQAAFHYTVPITVDTEDFRHPQ